MKKKLTSNPLNKSLVLHEGACNYNQLDQMTQLPLQHKQSPMRLRYRIL
jgi:hypothetical protein